MATDFVPLEDVQGPDYYSHRKDIVHLHIHISTEDIEIEAEEEKEI